MEEAVTRQDQCEEALRRALDVQQYIGMEGMDGDVEVDQRGIDAVVETDDDGRKFVSQKTRNYEKAPNFVSSIKDLDLCLRMLGRQGGKSPEWQTFVDDDRPIADYLVYVITVGDEPVRTLVVDYEMLREIYTSGKKRCENHWKVGDFVRYDSYEIDDMGPYPFKYDDDDGMFMCVNQPDIAESKAVMDVWTHPSYR